MVEDFQSAWALLLHYGSGRANFMVRVVWREAVRRPHGWIVNILGVTLDTNPTVRDTATMPLSLGGMGLRNAVHTSPAASCGILGRLPFMVRIAILLQDVRPHGASNIGGSTNGCRPTGWCCRVLTHRPGKPLRMASVHHSVTQTTLSPGIFATGGSTKLLQEWNTNTEKSFCHRRTVNGRCYRTTHVARVGTWSAARGLGPPAIGAQDVLFQGPLAPPSSPSLSLSLHASVVVSILSSPLATTELHVPERLGRRGFAVESAGVRICREAGGRVVADAMLREFDLAAPNPRDQRRLEILVDGLPLFGGAQLAVDATPVFPLHCDGSPHPRAAR